MLIVSLFASAIDCNCAAPLSYSVHRRFTRDISLLSFLGNAPTTPGSMASPHGGKRGISPESAEKDKITNNEPFKKVRGAKTPKLNSLQLDKLYKSTIKEYAVKKSTSNIIPNLKMVRTAKPPAPSEDSGHVMNTPQCSSVSTDGWITPRKTSKSLNLLTKNTNDVPVDENNRFLPLSGVETNAEMDNTPDVGAKTGAMAKTPRPPPIYTSGTTFEVIIGIVNSLHIPKTKITVKENDTESHTITTSALEHQQLLAAKLTELGIQFFTYTPKGSRPKSILIKGIKGNFDLEYIKNEILDLQIPNVEILNITKFAFDKKQPEKYHHLIQLSADSKTAELFKIKALAYQKVKWEHLRRQPLFQCKKCQRIGHASKNCHLQYRCVKCAQSHEPGACNIKLQDGRESLKCANCGSAGHPASYKGCPFMKFALKQKRETNSRHLRDITQKINKLSSTIRANTSFAQVLSGRPSQQHPNDPNLLRPRPTTRTPITPSYPGINAELPNNQPLPTKPPAWIEDLKNEFAAQVAIQFQTLAAQIAANTERIDYIFNTLFAD